jgi:hypothetical protein
MKKWYNSPRQEFQISGIANFRTNSFPAHTECKKPEKSIKLLKQ